MELTFDYLNNTLSEITKKREAVRKETFRKLNGLSREALLNLLVKVQRNSLTDFSTNELKQLIITMTPEKI